MDLNKKKKKIYQVLLSRSIKLNFQKKKKKMLHSSIIDHKFFLFFTISIQTNKNKVNH